MADTIQDVEVRWPYMHEPLWNASILVNLSSALRSQALTNEIWELKNPSLLKYLSEAQDDIASAIQLIEKRLGSKAA